MRTAAANATNIIDVRVHIESFTVRSFEPLPSVDQAFFSPGIARVHKCVFGVWAPRKTDECTDTIILTSQTGPS